MQLRSIAASLFGIAGFSLALPALAVTDIELSHQLDDARAAQLQQLVERFNGQSKDYKVHLVQRAAGAAPTALNLATREDVFVFAQQKAQFRPLYQVMKDAKEKFDDAKLAPELRVADEDGKGRLMALPVAMSTPVLFYNKAAFRHAGLDPDKPPRTWWEMQDAAGKLIDSGIECPYTTSWPAWVHIDNASALNGAEVATAKGLLDFNTLVQVKHVALLASWQKSSYFRYFGRRDEADRHFAAGECGMLTSASSLAATLRDAKALEIGVAPLPYYDDIPGAPRHTLADGGSLWVGQGRKPIEYKAVAKFVSFLLQPDAQVEIARAGGFLPLTVAARAATDSKLLGADLAGQRAAEQQLRGESGKRALRVSQIEPVRIIIEEELEKVWAGQIPAKQALDTAVMRGNAVLPAALKLAY